MQLSWEPQSFSHRCNCVNVGLSNPIEPNYLAVVDIHFEMGGPVYTPSSGICFTTKEPLRDFEWPRAGYAPQQVLLNRPAPRNAAGKSQVYRVIEVLCNVNIVEYGQVQFGVLATNVLPRDGYSSLNNADTWVFGIQEISDVSAFPTCFPGLQMTPA